MTSSKNLDGVPASELSKQSVEINLYRRTIAVHLSLMTLHSGCSRRQMTGNRAKAEECAEACKILLVNNYLYEHWLWLTKHKRDIQTPPNVSVLHSSLPQVYARTRPFEPPSMEQSSIPRCWSVDRRRVHHAQRLLLATATPFPRSLLPFTRSRSRVPVPQATG